MGDELPSLTVTVQEARKRQVDLSITLDADERQVLADRNLLASIESFSFNGSAMSPSAKTIHVKGRILADLHYVCGVSLRPFPERVDADVDQMFGDPVATPNAIDLDPYEEGDLEPLQDGTADVADVVYQLFALSLDPYPRHPDEPEAPAPDQSEEHDGERAKSPFAVLKNLKPSD